MSLTVTRSEANLLSMARVAVGLIPAVDAMRLLVTPQPVPPKLGPGARAALADTLSRGSALALGRQGGWLGIDGTRLWERSSPPPLEFSGNVVRLLSWLCTTPLAEVEVPPLVLKGELTPAEAMLVTVLLDRLVGTGCEGAVARQVALRGSPLVTLAHTALLTRVLPLDAAPAFDPKALGVWVEGLRALLARSWVAAERSKRDVTTADELLRLGRAQSLVLDAWLAAVDRAGRRELATFLVDAAVTWLEVPRSADELTRSMSPDAPLRERTEARRAAAALLRCLARLREWDQEHRAVRFIDDDYAKAQALVKDWGRLGERGWSKAAALVAELDAIPTLRPVEAPAP